MDQIDPKMDQKGQKIVVLSKKYLFFEDILFVEHTLSREIFMNEVRLGRSPTTSATLPQF